MDEFNVQAVLDHEQDAKNYWLAFNHNIHPTGWKDQLHSILDIDFSKLKGMKEEEAYPFLRSHIENFRVQNHDEAQQKITRMNTSLEKNKSIIFGRMAALTKHPMYRNTFTIFLTSLKRGPYVTDLGHTWQPLQFSSELKAFIHELLHFQTIIYYKPYILSKVHDEKKFQELKEALTFLLNYDFKDIIEIPDTGYPQHQDLRAKLETYRINSDKDFDKLVDYGCELLSS